MPAMRAYSDSEQSLQLFNFCLSIGLEYRLVVGVHMGAISAHSASAPGCYVFQGAVSGSTASGITSQPWKMSLVFVLIM